MEEEKLKIKNHYENKFSSSPCEVSDTEIDFIIKHDCECDWCHKSIFDLWDFPELLIKNDELLCENCYEEEYSLICPICENVYDMYDDESEYFRLSEYFILNESDANHEDKIPGIYSSDVCLPCDLLVPIRINNYAKIRWGMEHYEIESDYICLDCKEKLTMKSNYIKLLGIPCILLKRYENDKLLFSNYTKEQIKKMRQNLIDRRITCKGIIENANKKEAL